MKNKRGSPRWLVYAVAIVFGVIFSLTLMSIAWNNALDNNKREFSLESVSLKNTVFSNVRTAYNSLNSLSAFLTVNRDFHEHEFSILSKDLLQQFPYIEAVVFSSYIVEDGVLEAEQYTSSQQLGSFPVQYQHARKKHPFNKWHDLARDERYQQAMKAMFHSDSVVTAAIPAGDGRNRDYWMFKRLQVGNAEQGDKTNNIFGMIAIFVKTDKLLGTRLANSNLSVTMLNDSISLSGRQLLYDLKTDTDESKWSVVELSEEGVTQFPMYSVKLSIGREVAWSEVDKSLVYIVLLIGLGVTLLLVALVRSKDQQARQLRERNTVIESKVEEQTKELALARDEAIEASRIKSEFLAGMSHEIRTPLNAIIGMSELLSETPLSHEQKNYISVFKKAGDTLLSLVNDILDLSKIEANQLTLENIEFDLLEAVEECAEIYALKAAEKGVDLLSCVDADVANLRMGDPARLRQIVLNLISNALKFTELGEIVIRVQSVPDSEHDDAVLFSVSDTGIGIPKQKLEAIFASFTQADSSTTRKYGGTGLGLTICRSLVEMMHGKIWVESEEGKGSTFKFIVRLANVTTSGKVGTSTDIELHGKHVLLVDDSPTRSGIITAQLQHAGAQVTSIMGSVEALEKLKGDNTFDLLLTNNDLSDLNGFQLIEKVKQGNIGILSLIMLQAAELNQYMDKLKQLGVDSYLVKPVKRHELLNKVNDLLFIKQKGAQKNASSGHVEDSIKPLKILLVDDNPDNRLLIKAYLKKLPYALDEAENGQIAVDKFQQSKYDLVLMDVQMPVMDGHQATQTIRAFEQETTKEATPIIALTAHAFKEEIDKCLASGCNTHLSKPVKKTLLVDTIEELTR